MNSELSNLKDIKNIDITNTFENELYITIFISILLILLIGYIIKNHLIYKKDINEIQLLNLAKEKLLKIKDLNTKDMSYDFIRYGKYFKDIDIELYNECLNIAYNKRYKKNVKELTKKEKEKFISFLKKVNNKNIQKIIKNKGKNKNV